MIYRLVILNGDRRGERITVTEEPMSIGRGETCDIRFDDPEVASAHAEISHTPEGLVIRDLGSMNRLLVDNREVRTANLKHGAVVEVGRTRFLVQAYVQAEVQGDDEEVRRHKQWVVAGGVVILVIAILYGMHRCKPQPAVKPNPSGRRTPAQYQPPPVAPQPAATPSNTPPPLSAARPMPSTETGGVETVQAAAPPSPPVKVPPHAPNPPATTAVESAETAWTASTSKVAEAAEDTIAVAQKELQEAAKALLDSKVKDMMEEAHDLATNRNPAAAEQILATIEKIKPDYVDASVARAELLEEQGKLEPAIALWEDILRRDRNAPVAAEAAQKLKQLARAREEFVFPFVGRIKIISAEINKFPENDRFREMRLLTIRLTATELQKELEAAAVRVEVRFYDWNRKSGKISPTLARVPTNAVTVAGPWRATEEKTVEASYIVPATEGSAARPEEYYGFVIRVYYFGGLQDEWVQPKDLPADVELAVPETAPATNRPAAAVTGANPS